MHFFRALCGKSRIYLSGIIIKRFSQFRVIFIFIFVSLLGATLDASPDLSINSSFEIDDIVPREPHVDDWMRVRVHVHNNGAEEVNNVSVDLFKNASGDLNGRSGDMSYVLKKLPGGGDLPIDFVFKAKGDLNLRVMVDAPNALHEADRSNNLTESKSVSVNATPLDDDKYDTEENNDTLLSASQLTNNGYSLVSKDDDYFEIKALPGDNIVLKIYNFEYQVSNLGLFLYDKNSNLLRAFEGVGNIKNVNYRVPLDSGSPNQQKSFYIYVKPGLNPTRYFLEVFCGKTPDIEITSTTPVVKKVIDEMKIKISGTSLAPQFDLLTLKYHYKIDYNINVKNAGESLKAGDFFYVDLFRNRTLKPSSGEFGNMSVITVNASDLVKGGVQISDIIPVTDIFPVVDGKIVIGHYTYFALADSDGYLNDLNRDNNLNGPLIVRADAKTGIIDDDSSLSFEVDTSNFIHIPFDQNSGSYFSLSDLPGIQKFSDFRIWTTIGNNDWTGLMQKIESKIAGETTLPDDAAENAGTLENDYLPWAGNPVTDIQSYKTSIHKEAGRYDHLVAWDDDYYSVSLNPGETLECLLQFRNIDGDLDLELYDMDTHNLLESSSASFDREVLNYQNASANPKNYLLHVIPREVNPDYTMIINKFQSVPDRDLEVTYLKITPTPNNNSSLDMALHYKNRGSVGLSGSKIAIYRSASKINDITNMTPVKTIDIGDMAGGQEIEQEAIQKITFPAGNNEINFYVVLDFENKIIEKNELNNTADAVVDTPWFVVDDNLEINGGKNNNQYTSATPIKFGSYENLVALDEDWYVISLAPGKKLAVSLLFENDYGDLDIEAYRKINTPGGNTLEYLTTSNGRTDDEYMEHLNTASSSEDIYLRVFSPNVGTSSSPKSNTYTLNLEDKIPPGQNDLVITSMVTSPLSGLEGDLYRTTIAVQNQGSEKISPTEKISVDLVINGLPGSAAMGQYSRYFAFFTDGLDAGGSIYATFEYHLSRGQYQATAIVDTDNRIKELSETNNIFTSQKIIVGTQSVPDASLKILSVTKTNNNLDAAVEVSNLGDLQIASLNYRAYLLEANNGAAGRAIRTWDISDAAIINSGNVLNITFTFPLDYIPAGNYYFAIEADPAGLLIEKTKANNYSQFTNSMITISNPDKTYILQTLRALKYASPGVDTVMELYSKNGQVRTLIRMSDDSDSMYSYLKVALPAGEYLVRVYAYGGAMGYYNFYAGSMERTGITGISLRDPSLYERNDTPENPSEYNIGNSVILKQSIDTLTDEDWFHFIVP